MRFHSNAGTVPIYERLKEVTWWAPVTPGLELRFSPSQGHRQKLAHKRQLKGRESMPKEGSLAGGGNLQCYFKGGKKKKGTAFDWLFLGAGITFFFSFCLFVLSQVSIN